jgi:hypothetical protein
LHFFFSVGIKKLHVGTIFLI